MRKVKYYIEPKSPFCRGSVLAFALSLALRAAWAVFFTADARGRGLALHVLLPTVCCGAFILLLLLQGRERLWLTFFPALGGVAFFVLKAAGFTPAHRILCTALYLSVAALYGAAVFGIAPIKPFLIPLFGLPLLYHIFVEDLIMNLPVYTMSNWLQEWSVLCIMAGLLLVSLGLRRED